MALAWRFLAGRLAWRWTSRETSSKGRGQGESEHTDYCSGGARKGFSISAGGGRRGGRHASGAGPGESRLTGVGERRCAQSERETRQAKGGWSERWSALRTSVCQRHRWPFGAGRPTLALIAAEARGTQSAGRRSRRTFGPVCGADEHDRRAAQDRQAERALPRDRHCEGGSAGRGRPSATAGARWRRGRTRTGDLLLDVVQDQVKQLVVALKRARHCRVRSKPSAAAPSTGREARGR